MSLRSRRTRASVIPARAYASNMDEDEIESWYSDAMQKLSDDYIQDLETAKDNDKPRLAKEYHEKIEETQKKYEQLYHKFLKKYPAILNAPKERPEEPEKKVKKHNPLDFSHNYNYVGFTSDLSMRSEVRWMKFKIAMRHFLEKTRLDIMFWWMSKFFAWVGRIFGIIFGAIGGFFKRIFMAIVWFVKIIIKFILKCLGFVGKKLGFVFRKIGGWIKIVYDKYKAWKQARAEKKKEAKEKAAAEKEEAEKKATEAKKAQQAPKQP